MAEESEEERRARKRRDADRGYRVLYEELVAKVEELEAVARAEGWKARGDADAEVSAIALEEFAADQDRCYPEDIFPKPSLEDYRQLHKGLEQLNLTLDSFSADLMRRGANLARERAATIRALDEEDSG